MVRSSQLLTRIRWINRCQGPPGAFRPGGKCCFMNSGEAVNS